MFLSIFSQKESLFYIYNTPRSLYFLIFNPHKQSQLFSPFYPLQKQNIFLKFIINTTSILSQRDN